MRWSQTDIAVKIRKSFPEEWLVGVPIRFLQDLLRASPFVDFAIWAELQDEGLPLGCSLGRNSKGRASAVLGRQAGVLDHRLALAPVIELGVGERAHLARCIEFANAGRLPFDDEYVAPVDLRYAAFATVAFAWAGGNRLRQWRESCAGALRELSQRLAPVSRALRLWQSPSVHAVAQNTHIALICVLTWVMGWPDWRLAQRFVTGFNIVGRLEETGVWERCESSEPVSEDRLLAESTALLRSRDKRRIDPEVEFLWDSCLKEREKGWAAPPASRAAMDREYGAGRWAAVPSFVHVQQNGKRRRIDDAKAGGQNGATVYPEKWHLPSAFTPALYGKVLRHRPGGAANTEGGLLSPSPPAGLSRGPAGRPPGFFVWAWWALAGLQGCVVRPGVWRAPSGRKPRRETSPMRD